MSPRPQCNNTPATRPPPPPCTQRPRFAALSTWAAAVAAVAAAKTGAADGGASTTAAETTRPRCASRCSRHWRGAHGERARRAVAAHHRDHHLRRREQLAVTWSRPSRTARQRGHCAGELHHRQRDRPPAGVRMPGRLYFCRRSPRWTSRRWTSTPSSVALSPAMGTVLNKLRSPWCRCRTRRRRGPARDTLVTVVTDALRRPTTTALGGQPASATGTAPRWCRTRRPPHPRGRAPRPCAPRGAAPAERRRGRRRHAPRRRWLRARARASRAVPPGRLCGAVGRPAGRRAAHAVPGAAVRRRPAGRPRERERRRCAPRRAATTAGGAAHGYGRVAPRVSSSAASYTATPCVKLRMGLAHAHPIRHGAAAGSRSLRPTAEALRWPWRTGARRRRRRRSPIRRLEVARSGPYGRSRTGRAAGPRRPPFFDRRSQGRGRRAPAGHASRRRTRSCAPSRDAATSSPGSFRSRRRGPRPPAARRTLPRAGAPAPGPGGSPRRASATPSAFSSAKATSARPS